jgi:hypothetical protein
MDKHTKGEQVEKVIYLLPDHFYFLTRPDRHDERRETGEAYGRVADPSTRTTRESPTPRTARIDVGGVSHLATDFMRALRDIAPGFDI